MPQQSGLGVKVCDIITAAALSNPTSVEPMERITESGHSKSHLEEGIFVKADLFNSDADEEDDPRDESYELRTSKTRSPARKRAKIVSGSSTANGKKKNLSLLPTMPLDILFEIFGQLSPKDILSVSRASKIFRETLMTRRATTVWKAARCRISAPECPSWMSEPAWAALLFGHICQSCGTNNVHKVDFLLLKRVCTSCKKTHLLVSSKVARRHPGILDLVPSTDISARYYYGLSSKNSYYWDTDVEAMVVRLSNLEADVKDLPNSRKILLDFKEEHKQRVTGIQQASPQWQAWSNAVQLERDEERREAQNRRIAQIKDRFRELGYIDEDFSFLSYQKECNSTAPLTKKGWKRIRSSLEPQAMARKADRLETMRLNRRPIIHSRYKDYQRTLHPSQWKYIPQTSEIISYEPFAKHVNAPVEAEITAATFDDAFAHLPELLAAAMEERKKFLRDLLPNRSIVNEDENMDASHDPMDLATAVFRCKEDWAFLFGWDEIASHHCRREREGLLLTYNEDLQPKTTVPLVEYDPLVADMVKKVEEIAGLDCATTTPADLDKKNVRFSCDSCRSHTEGWKQYEIGYDWRTLAVHIPMDPKYHYPNPSIRVLSSREAEEVRQCEYKNKWMATQWTCTHCSEHLDNLQVGEAIMQHLSDSHGIETPSDPTDYLFVGRLRNDWVNPPKFTVHPDKIAELLPSFRCLPETLTSEPLCILPNIEDHLKKIHEIEDAEIGLEDGVTAIPYSGNGLD